MAQFILVVSTLAAHLYYLFSTTFVDWPEMILYPWFLTKGLLYYRDVVLAYVPGAYYLLYALYSLIGFSASSERAIAYGFILVTDVLVYVIVRRMTANKWAALGSLVFFVLWQPIFSGNTIWYETILAPLYLVTYIFALRYFKRSSALSALYLGITLAFAALIKQTALWSVLLILIFVWNFRHALIIAGTVLAANLLVWSYFAFQGVGREYLFWTYGFLIGLTKEGSYYVLWPTRTELALILPALLPLAFLLFSRKKRDIWLLLGWSAALFVAGLPRWGLHRLQPMLAFSALGFGVVAEMILGSKKRSLLIAGAVLLFLVAAGSWRSLRVFVTLRDPMQPQFFGEQYHKLLAFVGSNTHGPIYVLGNYDYIYLGMNERPTVLPWVPLFPWNAQVPGIKERLIASLEAQRVPYILYIPFHPREGYYLDYTPQELLLYMDRKYEKIGPLPVEGGWLYQRK